MFDIFGKNRRLSWVALLLVVGVGHAWADPESDYELGFKAYVSEDLIAAMQYLGSAAQAGHVRAQVLYAYILDKAEENAEALRYYGMAAEAGDGDAMYALGSMYASADGVDRDYPKAIEWYEKAAALNHADALEVLGLAYLDGGLGLEQDAERGRELLQRAAENGNEDARQRLKNSEPQNAK